VEVLSSLSVNGTRGGNTEYTIDGTPSMWGTNAAYAPPTEMVAEFKVQTATYDASLGRSPGGNVNVVLRSGANQLHLEVHHFHNNQHMQGLDLFQRQLLYNPATGPVTPEKKKQVNPLNVLNRFGGTASGPLVRNKTFWVYSGEMLTRPGVERGSLFFSVPPLDQRQGDFSALARLGATYLVYDPATSRPAEAGRISRQPFANNVIPRARIDPVASNLLKYFPDPNTTGAVDGRNNYTYLQRSYNEFWTHTGKVDHNFSQKHRVFGRYNQTFQFSSGVVFDAKTTGRDRFRYNYGLGFDDVYILSPRLLVNLRYGFTRFEQTFESLSKGFDLASAGFAKPLADSIDPQARTFPQIAIQAQQTIGGQWPTSAISNYHTWAGDMSWNRGSHNVRFGGEHRLYREHNYNFTSMSPQFTFGNTWTRGPLDSAAGAPVGQGMASFLLGLPTDGQINVNDSVAEQSATTGFYVQDDWRVSSKLSLNLGLRWDLDWPVTERFNRSVRGFEANTQNPIGPAAIAAYARSPIPEVPVDRFRVNGGLTFAGVGGQPRGLWSADRNNFSPRVGVAYTPARKTVVRGGFGFYYVPLGVDRTDVNQSGFTVRNQLTPSLDNGQTFVATLANPFPDGYPRPLGSKGGLATDVGRSVTYFNPKPANGRQARFSIGVQRELPQSVVVEVSYVGNRGGDLGLTAPLNPVPVQYLSRTGVRDQATINFLSAQVNNPFFPLPGTDIAGRTVARQQLLRPYPH
jgi:hypothetical protein